MKRKRKNHNKRKKIIIIVAILIAVAAGAAFYFLRDREQEPSVPPTSQLTGLDVSQKESERPILGIMIENSLQARPQTGLGSAGIVFEATTEGGITRYLALYQENQPEEVGPVRSLRTHFLNWGMGFDTSIAHVGGSAEALSLEKERGARSLSQFTYPEPYYRIDTRQAPHNMYTRLADLRELQTELDHQKSSFAAIPRSSDAPTAEPNTPTIGINFSSSLYEVEFKYDAATNTYQRFLTGEPHIDEVTDKQIAVKNLVVMVTNVGSNTPQVIGSGEAFVFKDGAVQKVRWEQSDYNNRIKFVDSKGNQVALNRGSTWIAALSDSKRLTY